MSDYDRFKSDLNKLILGIGFVYAVYHMPAKIRWLTAGLVGMLVMWAFSLDYHAADEQRSPWTGMSYLWIIGAGALFFAIIAEGVRDHRAWKVAQAAAAAQAATAPAFIPAPVAPVQRTERTVRVTRTPPPPTPTSAPKPPVTPPPAPAPTVTRSSIIVVTNTHKPVRRAELNSGLRINDRRGFDPEVGE